MTTSVNRLEPLEIAGFRDDDVVEPRPARAHGWGVVALAAAASGLAVLAAALDSSTAIGPGRVLSAALVGLWASCAVWLASRRAHEPLPFLMAASGLVAGLAMLDAALLGRDLGSSALSDLAAAGRAVSVALLPAILLHLVLGLPDGRLGRPARRVTVGVGYASALGLGGVLFSERPALPSLGVLVLAAVGAVAALGGLAARWRSASPAELARLHWPVWAATVAVGVGSGAAALNALVDWPAPILAIAVGATAMVPISLAIAGSDETVVRIDRLLVHTITLAGLTGVAAASYVLIVLGFGPSLNAGERSVLGLSIAATTVAALLWVTARRRLSEFATRRVYGERYAPEEILRTFGSRLTRALPLDELLLQLAESLKRTMALDVAEVWTRSPGGRLERTVSVPERGPAELVLGAAEENVVARAGASGPAWARVWLPALVPADGTDPVLRVAPVTNSGELLGLLAVRRPNGAPAFDDNDDRALTDLARQVGLALHNAKLDFALQESLDEVRRQADELRASRARIVEAGDAQRRAIERDLHDGAQQHLVALAVSVRLARQLADSDPPAAKGMLEQMGVDVQDAVQELRNLAHGIYPPLLAERGLPEALSAAANRAVLATVVHAEGVGRHPQAMEAAVYFCVLEALQNAGKHAGPDAQASITLREDEGALLFEVADDGAGFDMASGAHRGHGFVNMADRVGAMGGTVSVESALNHGTRLSGRIPL